MKRNFRHRNTLLYFSRWSRKEYAVFAAMGKNVAISTVPITICERALLKSARKGIIVSDACCFEEQGTPKEDLFCGGKPWIPVYVGKVYADENGNKINECNRIKGYAICRRTSFL